MAARRVVVDGSNIATEGRTVPSLKQLNEAVLAFLNEYPDTEVTVVVDATFGHRIDPAEIAEFEEAEANNELVSPPAGAIGRGDAFLLRIAGKIGATVLSNDSFQEFHGEHDWLFDEARLIGGKPVPGIGWIFTDRTPVRGMKSRKAVKDAKKKPGAVTASGEALGPMPSPKAPPPRRKGEDRKGADRRGEDRAEDRKGDDRRGGEDRKGGDDNVAEAIAAATEESVSGGAGSRKRRRKKRGSRPAEPVNEAISFLNFIGANPLGSQVTGEVETFTSHGAFVQAGGARCYVPISALGEPPPRAARDVLNKGEIRAFVVQALDPQRRGIELALPEFAHVAGAPLPETIEAEIEELEAVKAPRGGKPARKAATTAKKAGPAAGAPRAGLPSARQGAAPARGAARAGAGPAAGSAAAGSAAAPAAAVPAAAGARKAPKKAVAKKAASPVLVEAAAMEASVGLAAEPRAEPAAADAKPAAADARPAAAAKPAAEAGPAKKASAPAKKAADKKASAKKAGGPAKKAAAEKAAPVQKAAAKKATPAKKAGAAAKKSGAAAKKSGAAAKKSGAAAKKGGAAAKKGGASTKKAGASAKKAGASPVAPAE